MRDSRDVFHLAIPARDLDEAHRFYVEQLGCKLARRYPDRITLDFFGGTLFEKFVLQGRFNAFRTLCHQHGCRWVEVSNGTIPMSGAEKTACIAELRSDFDVLSEVGFKDAGRSGELTPADWVGCIRDDLEAGASLVVTEARESGRSGICTPDGRPRQDVVDAILGSDVDVRKIVFEAPTKDLQTYFIRRAGPEVNLGNVAMADVIPLETLRLGLRADTLLASLEAAHA